jgi:colanic acid biosynthesis glycosyl transferase WcaI
MRAPEGDEMTAANRPQRVLILNQYVVPDTTASARYVFAIARALADAGMDVTVLAAEPSYHDAPVSAPHHEVRDRVRIVRQPLGRWAGHRSKARRLGGYLRYLAGAALLGARIVRDAGPDLVMCFSNPPFTPLIARWLARRAGSPMVYVIHDLHPDILVATNRAFLPRPVVWIWELLNRLMLDAASAVVVVGEGMREVLVEEKRASPERVHVIPLWAEPELQPHPRDERLREELGIGADELLLLSAGNLGVVHSLEPVVAAARRLDGRSVRFLFVASGVRVDQWRAGFDGLANALFLPYGTDEFLSRVVAACDAGLVPLSPGFEHHPIPARGYIFLSAGRPLLTVMNPRADLARLVSECDCGFNALDGVALSDWVELNLADRARLEESGRRAREVYDERFTRKAVLNRYVGLCTAIQADQSQQRSS